MSRPISSGTLVLLVALVVAPDLQGQGVLDRGEWAAFGVELGAFSPLSSFQDEMFGESSFETGAALGVSATVWPTTLIGFRAKVVRSDTDGANETSDFAPLATQNPTQWSFTGEVTGRLPLERGIVSAYPYLSLGAGMRHYTWDAARHDEDKFFSWTAAAGFDIRPAALGPFGITTELRGYRSQFKGFGIHGGNWRPGTFAREEGEIGFYGGVVDKIWSHDMLITIGLSYSY